MKTFRRLKDVAALEQFETVIKKVKTQPEIADAMEKIGYSPTMLEQGEEYLRIAREKYDESVYERDVYNITQSKYKQQRKILDSRYRLHRRKVRLFSPEIPGLEERLSMTGPYPKGFAAWMYMVSKFYMEILNDPELLARLQGFGVGEAELREVLSDTRELKAILAKKMRAVGDMRLATAEKNKAFSTLHRWMRSLFNAAKLTLKEEPTLMETLERHLS